MERRAQPSLVVDLAVGLAAGLAATWATDLAQGPLRRATPDNAKSREALSALATQLDLPNRSKMKKEELVAALKSKGGKPR